MVGDGRLEVPLDDTIDPLVTGIVLTALVVE